MLAPLHTPQRGWKHGAAEEEMKASTGRFKWEEPGAELGAALAMMSPHVASAPEEPPSEFLL